MRRVIVSAGEEPSQHGQPIFGELIADELVPKLLPLDREIKGGGQSALPPSREAPQSDSGRCIRCQ